VGWVEKDKGERERGKAKVSMMQKSKSKRKKTSPGGRKEGADCSIRTCSPSAPAPLLSLHTTGGTHLFVCHLSSWWVVGLR